MRWDLYPLVKTKDGRRRGEFPLGTLSLNNDGEINIYCPDAQTATKLRLHFSSPISVRRSLGSQASVVFHSWETISPGDDDYFEEALSRLHWLNLAAVPYTPS